MREQNQSTDHSSDHTPRSTAAWLLTSIAGANVDVDAIATLARVSVGRLDACRSGDQRLDPAEQMRLAAAVVTLAPDHARRAHALYAQAQSELRTLAGEVQSQGTYPGTAASKTRARSREAQTLAKQLVARADDLCMAARAFVAASASLRATAGDVLREEIARFTVDARTRGASPEEALVLVKSAVEPALPAERVERDQFTSQIIEWFVDAYYVA